MCLRFDVVHIRKDRLDELLVSLDLTWNILRLRI